MRVREVPGVDLGPAVEQQGRHDQEDPAQHQPGRPGVRAVETGRPAFLLRLVAQPDDRERDQPGQDQHREQILQEPQRERVPDPGDGEAAGEQVTVGLDDREDQNNEAPEHDEVRQPGDRPLEQLPLPEHLGRLHLGVPLRMRTNGRDPLRRRLPRQTQTPQPPQPTTGQHGRGRGHDQAKDDSQDHRGPPRAALADKRTLPAFARLGRRPDDATTSILLIGNFPPRRHFVRADFDIRYK